MNTTSTIGHLTNNDSSLARWHEATCAAAALDCDFWAVLLRQYGAVPPVLLTLVLADRKVRRAAALGIIIRPPW